jgi:5-methylcytosine-specific restriction enzyme subunit McrC
MLSYAVRFNVNEIILFFPNTLTQNQEQETELTIKDSFAEEKIISIKAIQLPIINRQLFEHQSELNTSLNELFESTKIELRNRLEQILN